MIFKRFHIDGFGIWCNQTFDSLEPGLNIFFAANEGGKTTLMNFVRAMLYGFRSSRSRHGPRYEPLRGGKHGGYLEIHDDGKTFRITRTEDGSSPGDLQITDESGKELPKPKDRLTGFLNDTSRELYEDVFAFGLSALQELLGNDEILKAGMATSGIEPRGFQKKLEKEGDKYFRKNQRGKSRKVHDLLADIEELQTEIKHLEERPKDYSQLLEERESLKEALVDLDEKSKENRNTVKTAEMHKNAWPSYKDLLNAESALEAFNVSTGEAKTAEKIHAQLIEELAEKERELQDPENNLQSDGASPRDPGTGKKVKLIGSVALASVGLALVGLALWKQSWPAGMAGMVAAIVAYFLYRQIETLKEKEDNQNKAEQNNLQSVKDQLEQLDKGREQYKEAWLTFKAKADKQENVNDLRASLENIGTKNESERLLVDAQTAVETTGEDDSALNKAIGRIEANMAQLEGDVDLDTLLLKREQKRTDLKNAIEMWVELKVTAKLFGLAMEAYEKDDQDSIVERASKYFSIMTQEAYSQVLVPRGEQDKKTIQVEATASGNRKEPDELSQATKEQLYLAMRLANASHYAERCVDLPLITDDILVNFDEDRAKAAAKLLVTYAADGHQVLLFTCHQRMVDVFTAQAPQTKLIRLSPSVV